MRTASRWIVGLVAIVHGLIHLMGVVKGFGWAEVSELTEPIGTSMAVAWAVAAVVTIAAGVMLLARLRGWWVVAAAAALVSQAVVLTSWADAKAGTVANVLLGLAALYGFRAQGPTSFRAAYRRVADEVVREAESAAAGRAVALVAEDDLAALPAPVAGYVRAGSAVGRPHVVGFRARIHGRIRAGADQPWMPWVGEQVNTFVPRPSRVFFMDATMKGLPTDVLHAYVGPSASMRVRVASLLEIVDAAGAEMDQSETVTLLNDLCVLAPAALVDAPIRWTPIDDHRARATFSNAGHTVSAELWFDDDHRLVDFVSDDRLAASRDGRQFTPRRWSTPIADYRSVGGRRVGTSGTGRWHPVEGPSFDYLEFHVDGIEYLESGPPGHRDASGIGAADRRGEREGVSGR